MRMMMRCEDGAGFDLLQRFRGRRGGGGFRRIGVFFILVFYAYAA